jgi:hypothetical protein
VIADSILLESDHQGLRRHNGIPPASQPVLAGAIDLECSSGRFGTCWLCHADKGLIACIIQGGSVD